MEDTEKSFAAQLYNFTQKNLERKFEDVILGLTATEEPPEPLTLESIKRAVLEHRIGQTIPMEMTVISWPDGRTVRIHDHMLAEKDTLNYITLQVQEKGATLYRYDPSALFNFDFNMRDIDLDNIDGNPPTVEEDGPIH